MKNLFEMQAGEVFRDKTNGKYWKITRINFSDRPAKHVQYSVVKCNKNGKAFRAWNGFSFFFNEKERLEKFFEYVGDFTDAPKVSQDGIESGIKKRRIQYLKEHIAILQKELDRLTQ